jgi:hypothetical protein
MTEKDEQALLVFERKVFRRKCGPKYENGEWKSKKIEKYKRSANEKIY